MYDKITIDRIQLMHPSLRDKLERDYLEINKNLPKGVRLRFTHTLRTIKEQDDLYAQGRTKKGSIVTNAKGGQSIHNYGLAFDIVIMLEKDGIWGISWDFDKHWQKVVDFFKANGWTWGGDWKFKDNPHFEFSQGKSWKYFSQLNKDKYGYVIL